MINERNQQIPPKSTDSSGEEGVVRLQPSRASTQPKDYLHKPSIVFFGSGPVAEASLEFLVRHFSIEAVITKPSTHKVMAHAAPDVTVHVVATSEELNSLIEARSFESRLGLVVDFGIIMDQALIDSFELGILNSHFSLLPQWRGADPITFAILSGQETTGVSLMLLVEKLDEGPLLAQTPLPMLPEITGPELTRQLVELSNSMLEQYVPLYVKGQLKPVEQDSRQTPSYSHKLQKTDGIIDWHKPAVRIEREIRAYLVWPRSRTRLAGHDVIITSAKIIKQTGPAGSYQATKNQLIVFCGEAALEITRLQPAGKKQMSVSAFLAGYKL